jgi:hypothetical protein
MQTNTTIEAERTEVFGIAFNIEKLTPYLAGPPAAVIAEHIGMHRSTVHRVLQGTPPSSKFIAGILASFPVTFADVFDIVATENGDPGAQEV